MIPSITPIKCIIGERIKQLKIVTSNMIRPAPVYPRMNLCIPSEPSKIPQTPAGILLEDLESGVEAVDTALARGGGALSSFANSANDPSGFQSCVPSSRARV